MVSRPILLRRIVKRVLKNGRISLVGGILCSLLWPACSSPENRREAGTAQTSYPLADIVLDDTDFIDNIPRGHMFVNARQIGAAWLFNNTGLQMTTRTNYVKKIHIPEDGKYFLFVRSQGQPGGSLRIAVGNKAIDRDLGNDSLKFEMAGEFDLKAGETEVRIMRIERSPVFDAMVLTKNESFSENDLLSRQGSASAELLKEYPIPDPYAVKFGDLDGDKRMDFVVLTRNYSAYAFDHDGAEFWRWEAPQEGADLRGQFEAPGLVWDLDQDGAAEVFHWRRIDGREFLAAADGKTGEIKMKTLWPVVEAPHVYNNFRLAIANLADGGYPSNVIAFTDMGDSINITAYDSQLKAVWRWGRALKKDHMGHYVYPFDADRDGKDEILAGFMLLDDDGSEIWDISGLFYDHHDHADSYAFADLDGDGTTEAIGVFSDAGPLALDLSSAEILWQNTAEHAQQVEAGHFLKGFTNPQAAVGARFYGNRSAGEAYLWAQVHWFDGQGALIKKWPANPLTGNPVFVKGDWRGDGKEVLFWYKFYMNDQGRGIFHFPEPVYHMLDFMGRGAEEVITIEGGKLRVYGYKDLLPGTRAPRGASYLKNRVANHSHYGNG